MALPLTEKLRRVLTFLVGARNPRIIATLGRRGFSPADLEEGWSLFQVAAGARLSYTPATSDPLAPSRMRALLGTLDEWENAWYPVISATLQRHYPDLHATVFHNLPQTDGPELLLSVATLLDRLAALAETEASQPADALLERRGLTAEVRAEATALIAEAKEAGEAVPLDVDPQARDEQARAADAVWAWYLEWSQIARTLITRGDVLIRLGLRTPKRRGRDSREAEESPEMIEPEEASE